MESLCFHIQRFSVHYRPSIKLKNESEMKNMYYLCSHENRCCTKDNWPDISIHRVYHSHSHILNLLYRNKIVVFHPKSLSAMKRAGKSNAAWA